MEITRSLPLIDKETINSDTLNVTEQCIETQEGSHKRLHVTSSIDTALSTIFPEQPYKDKTLKKAKGILGNICNQLSDTDIEILISEIQYLTESWLDRYEEGIFSGKTLSELLNEV